MSKSRDIADSAATINFIDTVTSNVQTQMNAKGTVSSLSDLSITASAAELNYTDGVTSAIQTQLDAKPDNLADLGVTASSTELNYTDGVTSAIQTQLDAKEPADATILKDADIGSSVQAYDADTAKYDDTTANFTGTLQNGGSNVVVDSDIGSSVLGYVAPSTSGNVLSSNGSAWISAAFSAGNASVYTANGSSVPVGNAFLMTVATSLPSGFYFSGNTLYAASGQSWIGFNNYYYTTASIYRLGVATNWSTNPEVAAAFFGTSGAFNSYSFKFYLDSNNPWYWIRIK